MKKDLNKEIEKLIQNGSSLAKIMFILDNEKKLTKEEYDKILNNFMKTVTIDECIGFMGLFSVFDNEVIKLIHEKIKKELPSSNKTMLLSKISSPLEKDQMFRAFVTQLLKGVVDTKDKNLVTNVLMAANELPIDEKKKLVDSLGLNIFLRSKIKDLLNSEYLDEDEISDKVDFIIKHSKKYIKLLVLRICNDLPLNEVKKLVISIIIDYNKDLDTESILNILIYTGSIDIDMMEEIINITGIKDLLSNNYDLIGAMLNRELNKENLNKDTLKKLRFLHSYLFGESIQIVKPTGLVRRKSDQIKGEQ